MIGAQGGVCVVCRERPATQVDHDHATGKVRGILCLSCNAGLGAAGHDVAVLRSAIKYLTVRHSGQSVHEEAAPYRKKCPRCGKDKSLEDFVRNRSRPQGRGSYCRRCHNEDQRGWHESRGGRWRYLVRYRYGADSTVVERMLEGQGRKCAICRKRGATHVDHDHDTGVLRGILCFNCNRMLGYARDDLIWFEKAIAYLEQHSGDVREQPAPYIIHAA